MSKPRATRKFSSEIIQSSEPIIDEAKLRLQQTIDENLDYLDFENLSLNFLPEGFCEASQQGKLQSLTGLSLNGNSFAVLPREIRYLTQLEELHLESNNIKETTRDLRELTNLQRLHLFNNQLQTLSTDIGSLGNLTRLFLENNYIQQLPPHIGLLVNLRWLSLDGNLLVTIPPEISRLENLAWLSLDSNKLESLPNEIGRLSNLKSLSLVNNPSLVFLPRTFIQLSSLKDLRASSFFKLPSEVVNDSAAARAIIKYLESVIKQFNLLFDPKGHWQPDSSVNNCGKCAELFTLTNRRHHCRLCGLLYCKKCCSSSLNVPVMNTVRICDKCKQVLIYTAAAANVTEQQVDIKVDNTTPVNNYVFGLTKDEEISLSTDEKRTKLETQLRTLNKIMDEALNKKQEFNRIIQSHSSQFDSTTQALIESAQKELSAHDNYVFDLAQSQMQIQKAIQELENEAILTARQEAKLAAELASNSFMKNNVVDFIEAADDSEFDNTGQDDYVTESDEYIEQDDSNIDSEFSLNDADTNTNSNNENNN
eukprot:TRINITY_DN8466_c0_g1_i1.p1 TRINITY_DN8466_c0_g1~~TRINITY_DN8466_c0_g1_i1.p1  ORF type:complete len:537 (-),score=256.18 TRINITY_DN8466_c0_g1_i1:80-1690(-)